ncbi:MAG: hypothetical protein QM737_02875 [Ferruginibacter sp.]
MALSDKLHELHGNLKKSFFEHDLPTYRYPNDIVEEVDDILQRMDRLRDKIDNSIYYTGSHRFNDGGQWEAYQQAWVQTKVEVYALAGDLITEYPFKNKVEDEVQNDYPFASEEVKNYQIALTKLRYEGKTDLVQEIYKRNFPRKK